MLYCVQLLLSLCKLAVHLKKTGQTKTDVILDILNVDNVKDIKVSKVELGNAMTTLQCLLIVVKSHVEHNVRFCCSWLS